MNLEAFEAYIQKSLPQLDTIHPHLQKAVQIMMLSGGKRFRPALLLSVVQAYRPLMVESSFSAAFAIECLHTYSLIHDDLPAMDDAALRRGVETLHVTYDETTAILVGDALNTYAFEVLSDAAFSAEVRIDLVRALAHNGGIHGMIVGQAVDCHFENHPLSIEDLKVLHNNKTAKLIAASLQMGAIIVGNKALEEALYGFGMDLGLLFQIQDDILDVTQSDEEAGKTTGNDENKNSFVNLLNLEGAISQANALSSKIQSQLEGFDVVLQEQLAPLLTHYLNRHKEH